MQQYAQQLQQAMQQAKVEMLLRALNDQCFKRCIVKPKSSFRSSDKKCVSNCVGLYTSAMGEIEKTLIEAAEQQLQDHSEGTIGYDGFGDDDSFGQSGNGDDNKSWF